MNSGKSRKSRQIGANGFLKKFVTLWVLASFILSSCPAYASRHDRLDLPRGDRQERRAERALQRAVMPTVTTPSIQPNLTPIFQNAIANRVGTLQQPRLHKANLVTSRREARDSSVQGHTARQQLTSNTIQTLDSGRARNVNGRLNLDLSSTKDNIVLGDKLFENSTSKSVTVTVGGEEQSFSAGSKVTAAEYASILQALNGGQSLVLDDNGSASGGKLDFETITSNGDNLRLSSLVIPEQVQAVGNFSRNSDVKIKGDLVNFGSIYALANRDGGTKASIATNNLHNQEGGLISSVANSSLGDDLASSVDLRLRADDTLSNSGRIESSGDLTLSAGSQVINGDSGARHDGSSSASATAQNNLYIEAPVISNSGLLAANSGNINVTAPVDGTSDGSITVNNDRGTFQALNGNINFRDSSASGKPTTLITGGDLLSKELNIFGGDGAVDVKVNKLTGGVSVKSGTAHITALQSNLIVNDIVTSGDPTLASQLDVIINATLVGSPYTIISGQNIVFTAPLAIDASNGAGAGGNILMVAGANFEDALTPAHIGEDWILGGTAAGGNIFSQNAGDVIQITSNGSTNAGNIRLIAFEATAGGQGDIFIPAAAITATGGVGGNNGDVTAIGRFISLGNINNRGIGSTATGDVSLNSFLPVVSGPNNRVVVIDATGVVTEGTFLVGGTPVTPGDMIVNNITAGNNVALRASNNLIMSGLINSRATSGTALNNIFLDGDSSITSPTGAALVAGNGIFTALIFAPPTNNFINTSSAGAAGDITIVAGAAFTETATNINITGASGTGGIVDFGFIPLDGLAADSTTAAGGDITIAAFGSVSLATNSGVISTSGAAGQANGNVTIVGTAGAGNNAISVQSEIDTTGGLALTGNITLSSSTPNVPVTVSKTTGAVTAGTFVGGAAAAGNIFSDLVTAAGTVSLSAGGNVFTNDIVSGDDVTITGNDVTTGAITLPDDITINAGNFATFSTVTGTAVTAFNVTAGSEVTLATTSVRSLSVASLDDIVITGSITAPSGIALVAGLSIFTTVGGLNISTAAAAGGGDIVMVAGATFTSDAATITVTGANAAGGAINFDNLALATLNTRGTAGNAAGGDITMVAFDGTVNDGFIVTDATTAITTGGSGTGANGNFTAVAGGDAGNTIGLIGTLNTTGGSAAGTGTVLISTRTPDTTPNIIVQRSNASLTNDFNGGALQNGTSFVGAITVNQANITLEAGGASNLNGTLTSTNGAINATAGTFMGASIVNAGTGSISLVSGNNLTVGGNLTARAGITLVSGHDIFPTVAGRTISTSGAGASGDVVVVAGAAFTQNATTVTITGASATGGRLDFDFNNLASINTTSTGGGGAGGDVTLVAFTGSDGTGIVQSDATTATLTGGNVAGANGNFTAVAGGTTGTTIGLLGTVNTTGGSAAGTGTVLIATRTPDTAPNVIIQRSNATLTNDFNGGTLQNGDSFLGAITVNQANITLEAGDASNFGALVSATGAINASAGTFMGAAAVNAGTGSIALVSGDNMQLGGNLTARSGILLVSGHDIFPTVSGRTISTSGTGNSGNVSIIAGAAFTQSATIVTINGASTTGGAVDFDFNDLTAINTTSTGLGGTGGDVTLVAFTGSDATGRVFMDATTSSILTGGNGGGANGDLIVVAGNNIDTAILLRNVNTTGGLLNTGDISITAATPDATPAVVFQKSNATTPGDFRGNPANNSAIAVNTLTVNNGADITIAGGPILAVSLLGGANSVLTMTAIGATSDIGVTNPVTLGTAIVTSGRDLDISLNQGAAGVATLTAAGLVSLGSATSGAINISAGFLDVVGAVTANSFSGVSLDDITLNNDITAPSGILLVSGRNIFPVATNLVDLRTTSATGNAGDITIIAGAAFNQNATSVTITGASLTGGSIDFDFNELNNIDARSTFLNGSGGDVTMIAFDGSDGTGFVFTDFATTLIRTGGNGTGTNGNFTAVAAASSGDGIGIRGTLNTTGGTATTGDVFIATATPDITPNVIIQKASAAITTGDFRFGPASASNVFVDDIIVGNGADITLNSGGDISGANFTGGANSILSINSVGTTLFDSTNIGTATITAGLDVIVNAGINQGLGATSLTITAVGDTTVDLINSGTVRIATGGNLFLGNTVTSGTSFVGTAGQFIDISNDITAPGGIVLVAGESIASFLGGVVDLSTASATANAGDITIVAGAAFTQNAGTVTITGASVPGGSIDFDFFAVNSITSRSTALNGVGGDITMTAFAGSTVGSGFIFTNPAPSTILTGGSGTGANGNFTAIGNAAAGFGVGIRGTLTTTGGLAGTGDVHVAAALPVTTTQVVIQKATGAITAGDFRGGATAGSDVFVDLVTVSNGADVTLIAGGNITADSITAGPLSVLSINSGDSTTINSSTAGTVTITAGTTVTAGDFLQGATGSLTITSVGSTVVDQINTGNVRISSGDFLDLTNTIVATGSVSAVATTDISISNDITAPGGILLVSGRNIVSTISSIIDLSTASTTTNGGDISIIAGAAFTQLPGSVTITGGSLTGGSIDFDFFGVSSITSRSTAANGSGGDINMIAFTGSLLSGGVFTDTAGTIITGGTGTGLNGDFNAIGGDIAGAAIGVRGSLNTTGGAAGSGNVYLAAATPLTTPNVVLSKNTASITTGNFRGGALTAGDIFADDITVAAGSSIVVEGNGFAFLRDLTGGANSALRVSAGTSVDVRTVSVGNLSLVAGTFIRLNGNILSPGGILMVAGTDIFPFAANLTIRSDSTTGDAGDLTLVAGAAFTQNATTVTITGASATGGRIDMDANNLSAITASSSFAGGDGGDITLVSLFGSNNTGEIFTDTTTAINAGGNGAGDNGNIRIVSAKTNGANGIFLNGAINLTGGVQGTGTISLNTSALPGAVTLTKATGAVTAGTFVGGALVNSSISSNNLTVRGGAITARSGANVVLGALDVSGNVNGAGGTINISTVSATSLSLGAVSANSVNSLTARGGTTSGNGGSILVTNTGAGGITVAGALNVGATEGNGGILNLNAQAGDLTFNAGASTLNASGATASATARQGGSITLTGNNIVGAGNVSLTANGVSGGNGGTILVTTNGGDISIGTGAGNFVAQANGPNGLINFTANAGGDIIVQNTGSVSSSTVSLLATTGALTINGAVTGTTAVNLQSGLANNITGTATVTGGLLTITAGTGSATLNTNVASLTLATNGNVNITETDDITLNTGTAGAGIFTLNATGDDITVGGVVTANGGINLTTSLTGTMGGAGTLTSAGQLSLTAGTGLVDVNSNVLSLTAASTGSVIVDETDNIILNAITTTTVDIQAGNGIARGTGVVDANSINFSALGGDIGASANFIQINNGASAVTLTADATGDIFISVQNAGPLALGTTTAGDDITLTSTAPITTTGDITANATTGTLDITTNNFTNSNDLSANIINIQSQAGSGLTIGGTNGTMTATTSINITATFGDLNFFGIQDFFGPTTLTAINTPTASVIINNGADIEGHSSVTVVSNQLTQIGTGVLTGNPLIIPNQFFTIANSTGDVNLGGNIVFNGQNLAILAQGNINITGGLTLIDLSDPALAAGSLFMLAGYNFTPATAGQQSTAATFTLTPGSQSTSGGNIVLGAANFNLSSAGGNGGNFTAIATTGTNAGTITLGNVNVSTSAGGAFGGDVRIIGEGGVTVGNVNAAGPGGNGDVLIAVAVPDITGGNITVTNGTVSGPGIFQPSAVSVGNMVAGTITGQNVTLAASTITTGGNVTATGALDITANILNADDALAANTITIQSQPGSGLTINGGAGGTMTATSIDITSTFGNLNFFGTLDFFGPTTLTAVNSPGASNIIANNGATITGANSVTVISEALLQLGTGTLTGNPLIIQNQFFTIANSTGDVTLNGPLVFNGQDLAILARGNIIIGALTLIDLSNAGNAGSLLMVAGYDFIPNTGLQVTSAATFTLVPGNQSATGGNIVLGSVNFDLSSNTGNGGNFTAIATTGVPNTGVITLGNVDASSGTGVGGNVLIIGEGGVNTGSINTVGGGGSGNVQIAVAVPDITGGNILVTNGTASGGSFQPTTLSSGNMVLGTINAANVTLTGAQAVANTITQNGLSTIGANTLTVNVGTGTATLDSTAVATLNVSGNGTVNVDNTLPLQLGTFSTSADTLTVNVTSTGVITTPLVGIIDVANLSITGTAGVGLDAIVFSSPITTLNSLTLTAAGGADLEIDNITLTAPNVTLASTAGDVNLTATGIVNASTSAIVDAFDSFSIAGTITTQTLTLQSGDNILTGDITGTLTAPTGTFLISTGGGIGFDENNRFVSNASQLLLTAGGGSIYVSSTNAIGVDVLDVSATGEVDLVASGAITLHDVTSGNGDITVIQNGVGTLTVAAGATINSTEGDVIISNFDINKKTGKILIDDGANIKGSGLAAGVGEVFITMGAIPLAPYLTKKAPKNVIVTAVPPGGVFFGKKGIDTKKETNIALNALGRDLVFSLAGKFSRKAIHVGSNVVITADPPGDAVPTRLEIGRHGATSTLTTALFGQPQTALNSGLNANITSGAATLTSTLPDDLVTRASSALLTDLNSKTSSAQLAEKSFEAYSTTDALSAIFGDDGNEQAAGGLLNAVLVSEVLPNAMLPSNQMNSIANAKGSTAITHNLADGCAVYAPAHNMTVKAGHAEIAIAGGSVVLVLVGVHGTSIYDLHDSKKEAVQVAFHNQSVALSPGRHAMVCPTEKRTYADANIAELILHRGMHNGRTARGGSIFTSEFAVNSAIDCVPALNSLMASNHPACAKLAAKLTKTQAVILYLSQSKEEFQQHVKMQITAMR